MEKVDNVKQIMSIINAIQGYIQQGGDVETIISYRQTNGSYKGIVEYLSIIKGETRMGDKIGDG